MKTLSVAFGDYPHVDPLLANDEQIPGYTVEPVTVRPIISAYRRMVRDLEFDVCEMAPVTYVMAREAGIPLVAIPVFLSRRFHHADIHCGPTSGVHAPKDLEGREVGVRAFSVSTGVWGRGVLADDYGVDLSSITWVVDDDDHIAGKEPANQRRVTDGRSLQSLLLAGEIAAAFGGNAGTGRAGAPREGWATAQGSTAAESDRTYPLFPDASATARDWYLRTGICPLHSVVVVRTELVDADQDLPSALYRALLQSKRRYLAGDPAWSRQPKMADLAQQLGEDPVPFGIVPNGNSVDALVRYSAEQGLIAPVASDALFAPGDYPIG